MWEISVISRGEFQFLKPLEPHMTVGGSDACDIVLPDLPPTSCAVFEFQQNEVMLRALHDSVFLNGKELRGEVTLHEHDICDLSHYRLQLFRRISPTVLHTPHDERSKKSVVEEPGALITFFTPDIQTFVQARIKIGKSAANDLQLTQAQKVSAEHAQIFFREDGYWIRDLSSRNGTFYYDHRISERKLPPRGVLRFGNLSIPYQITKHHEELSDHYIVPTASTQLLPQRLVGKSPAIKDLLARLQQVAAKEEPVLIEGEQGTGRRLSAFLLHQLHPQRRNEPFIILDCAQIPQHLLHSQLFGHHHYSFAGALTHELGAFQKAEKGTLFLQHVDALPDDLQELLAQSLKEKVIQPLGSSQKLNTNVRVIMSKGDNSENPTLSHTLSSSLFAACRYKWKLPSLRERIEDIPLLVRYFLQRSFCELSLGENVVAFLQEFFWSGNVVELSAAIDKAIVYTKFRGSETITIEDFQLKVAAKARVEISLQLERHELLQALEKYHGNIQKVTKALDWSRITVYRRMRQFKINPKAFRKKRL